MILPSAGVMLALAKLRSAAFRVTLVDGLSSSISIPILPLKLSLSASGVIEMASCLGRALTGTCVGASHTMAAGRRFTSSLACCVGDPQATASADASQRATQKSALNG